MKGNSFKFQNVHLWDSENELTDDYKAKALEMVCKHNLHNCAVTVNGCKKDISDRCRCGYSRTNTINETYVNQLTDRVLYQHRHCDDLRVVPYNLQMMMNWDSYLNVEYSGSENCVQYLNKYLFKGPAQRERIEMYSEQQRDSHDEIKLFIYGQVVWAMGAMWHFMGIRTIQHLFRLFVLSKCTLHSDWVLLSDLARSQIYKFITTDQLS